MVYSVYLVVYHTGGRRRVPAHWAILVTDSEGDLNGDLFHAVGSPFQGYQVGVKRNYNLSETQRKYSAILLGYIDDSQVDYLSGYATAVQAPGVSSTPLDPFAVSNPTMTPWDK
jgi:hypothetical protein